MCIHLYTDQKSSLVLRLLAVISVYTRQKLKHLKKFKERGRWLETGISREIQKLSAEIKQFKPAS